MTKKLYTWALIAFSGVSIALGVDMKITEFKVENNGRLMFSAQTSQQGFAPAMAATAGYDYKMMGKTDLSQPDWDVVGELSGDSPIRFSMDCVRDGKTYHFFTLIGTPRQPAPEVSNSTGATTVTHKAARLNGELLAGSPAATKIFWGAADGSLTGTWANEAALSTNATEGTFFVDVTGLSPSTTYYYRAYATNTTGEAWADTTATFTTAAPPPPLVVTKTYYYNELVRADDDVKSKDHCLRGATTASGVYLAPADTDGSYTYMEPKYNKELSLTIKREGIGNDVPENATVTSTKLHVRLWRKEKSGTAQKANCFMLHTAGDMVGQGQTDWRLLNFEDKAFQDANLPAQTWSTLVYDFPAFNRGSFSHLQIVSHRSDLLVGKEFRVAWAKLVIVYSVPQD